GGGEAGGAAGGGKGPDGGLAETGAEDNGMLRALGLVAGTVILLGGAVFTFMPKRRRLR
ncbi:LPXTG cell wall anchor domain-containing protein, partial [Streptomyces triticagri]